MPLTYLFAHIGLRAARVRVIFNLPPQFGHYPLPLAYVEWYTPFSTPDPITGLYSLQRSTRNHRPNASIVPVDRITRACHLMARAGAQVGRAWTTNNALDSATIFLFNPYINIDLFSSITLPRMSAIT